MGNTPNGNQITSKDPRSEMKREVSSDDHKFTEATSFPKNQTQSFEDTFVVKEVKVSPDKFNPFRKTIPKSDQPPLLD